LDLKNGSAYHHSKIVLPKVEARGVSIHASLEYELPFGLHRSLGSWTLSTCTQYIANSIFLGMNITTRIERQ